MGLKVRSVGVLQSKFLRTMLAFERLLRMCGFGVFVQFLLRGKGRGTSTAFDLPRVDVHVHLQLALLRVPLFAVSTGVWLVVRVHRSSVEVQLGLCVERLLAILLSALVALHLAMAYLVDLQVDLALEPHMTNVALHRFHVRVCQHVHLQGLCASKVLTASVANERLFLHGVHSLPMLLHQLWIIELPVALRTLVFAVRVLEHVVPQS